EGTFALLDLVHFKVSCDQHAFAGASMTPYSDGNADFGFSEAAPVSRREILSLFGALEQYSEHPLGAAVVNAAREEAIVMQPASSIEIHKGSGISGVVGTRRWESSLSKRSGHRDRGRGGAASPRMGGGGQDRLLTGLGRHS